MKYKIIIDSSLKKQFKVIPQKTSRIIVKNIENLSDNPRPRGYKKIKGAINKYRIRTGNYRIIYSITDDILTIEIIKIGHRKDIYKNL
jgi:mRNA interferase RelE/StbE